MPALAWIAIILGAAALYLCLSFAGVFRRRYRGGPLYFQSWAGVQLVPMRPIGPLSTAEAGRREHDGTVYYIAHFDDRGQALSVEKRRNGKTDYTYAYIYERRRVVRYYVERDGRVIGRQRGPGRAWTPIEPGGMPRF